MKLFVIDALADAPGAEWSPVGVMLLDFPSKKYEDAFDSGRAWWRRSLPSIKWLRLSTFRPDGDSLIRFGVYDDSGACLESMSWRTDASEIPNIEKRAGLTRWNGDSPAALVNY